MDDNKEPVSNNKRMNRQEYVRNYILTKSECRRCSSANLPVLKGFIDGQRKR